MMTERLKEWGPKAKRPRKKGVDDVGTVDRRTYNTESSTSTDRVENRYYGMFTASAQRSDDNWALYIYLWMDTVKVIIQNSPALLV